MSIVIFEGFGSCYLEFFENEASLCKKRKISLLLMSTILNMFITLHRIKQSEVESLKYQ